MVVITAIPQTPHNILICLTLVTFGFFGSLSHLFSLSLLILTLANNRKADNKNEISVRAKILFFSLTGCFFLFLINGFFFSSVGRLLNSLSPMLPMVFIGFLIIFHNVENFPISSRLISQSCQFSIFLSLCIYLLLTTVTEPGDFFYKYHDGRLTLFSGNPIPFSFAMLGVSIFCISDWKNSKTLERLIGFTFFLVGVYFATYLSGTRGTLLSMIFILPFLILFLSSRIFLTLIIILIFTLISLQFVSLAATNYLKGEYFDRIKNGLDTLIFFKNSDESIWQRLEMWTAASKAISESPMFGYGVTERFNSLKPFLRDFSDFYSHPHNDILASMISSGFLGFFLALTSLLSPFIAALIAPIKSSTKLYFGFMLSCLAIITGNVSTVFFNDITSAWIAFSTYLIWASDFKDYENKSPNLRI